MPAPLVRAVASMARRHVGLAPIDMTRTETPSVTDAATT